MPSGAFNGLESLPALGPGSIDSLPSLPALERAVPLSAAPEDGAQAQDPSVPAKGGPAAPIPQAPTIPFNGVDLPVYAFSSETNVSEDLVKAIDVTKDTLDLALYGMSLPNVADALVRAKERGVKIRLVCNELHMNPKSGNRSAQLQLLVDKGFDIRLLKGLGGTGIMHNKFAIFDGALVKAGSFNWSTYANDANFENALFFNEPGRIQGFQTYFEWIWAKGNVMNGTATSEPEVKNPPPADPSPSVDFKGQMFPAYVFSPLGDTETQLERAINMSEKSIDLAMFALFSAPVVDALIKARDRGVEVRIVVDRSQGKSSPAVKTLLDKGVPVRMSSGYAPKGVMHNKFSVFDGELLESGSFNWSFNAQNHNFENANFFSTGDQFGTQIVSAYQAYFEKILAQSDPMSGADTDPGSHPNPYPEVYELDPGSGASVPQAPAKPRNPDSYENWPGSAQ